MQSTNHYLTIFFNIMVNNTVQPSPFPLATGCQPQQSVSISLQFHYPAIKKNLGVISLSWSHLSRACSSLRVKPNIWEIPQTSTKWRVIKKVPSPCTMVANGILGLGELRDFIKETINHYDKCLNEKLKGRVSKGSGFLSGLHS